MPFAPVNKEVQRMRGKDKGAEREGAEAGRGNGRVERAERSYGKL